MHDESVVNRRLEQSFFHTAAHVARYAQRVAGGQLVHLVGIEVHQIRQFHPVPPGDREEGFLSLHFVENVFPLNRHVDLSRFPSVYRSRGNEQFLPYLQTFGGLWIGAKDGVGVDGKHARYGVDGVARLDEIHEVLFAVYRSLGKVLRRGAPVQEHQGQQEENEYEATSHSHSMVAGGLELMSYTTLFTPFT